MDSTNVSVSGECVRVRCFYFVLKYKTHFVYRYYKDTAGNFDVVETGKAATNKGFRERHLLVKGGRKVRVLFKVPVSFSQQRKLLVPGIDIAFAFKHAR